MVSYYGNNQQKEQVVNLDNVQSDKLEDLSPMPFGKHKGEPMQDIPARYLHWVWTECRANNPSSKKVVDYIRRNLNALRLEFRDGIWKRPNELDT